MLKGLFFLVKVTIFSIVVLVLGSLIHVGDRTVSDQIKTGLAHPKLKKVIEDSKEWIESQGNEVGNFESGSVIKRQRMKNKFQEKSRREDTDASPETIGHHDQGELRAVIRSALDDER